MSEDLKPYGQRGLLHALGSQAEPRRRRTEQFTPHWYCEICITSWGMDLKAMLNPRLLVPVAVRETGVCEYCGRDSKCYYIHETVEASQLRAAQQQLLQAQNEELRVAIQHIPLNEPRLQRARDLYEVYRSTRIDLHLGGKPIFDELTPAQQALWLRVANVSV